MVFLNLGIIFIAVGILGFILAIKYDIDVLAIVCITLFCVGTVITVCWRIDRDINPIAMDVYRGKATIAITYENGVPVDSVVVFKK